MIAADFIRPLQQARQPAPGRLLKPQPSGHLLDVGYQGLPRRFGGFTRVKKCHALTQITTTTWGGQ
jgi:hypothetical protein